MRRHRRPRRPRLAADRSGNMMIEFALALPVLALLIVGLVDLGSFSLQKSAMLQGAQAGAQYGIIAYSGNLTSTAEVANVNSTAQSATGLSGVIATNSVFCECVTGTAVACTTTCGAGQTLKGYVTVNTTKSFSSALSVATHTFAGFISWTPPSTVSASVTMIVP
jgi:Flp pilus assembly protein TadG